MVIAGVNGVGKSNLFDALRHLSNLVRLSLREAFETERGSLEDLFTLHSSGERASAITYAVEMLLPRHITDSFNESVSLKYIRMRYEISVSYSREERRLVLKHEKLAPIKRGDDIFLDVYGKYLGPLPKLTGGRTPFIDTEGSTILISQDGRSGNKRTYSAEQAQRSVISTVLTVEFPHVYACKNLLENILFLQLNPDKLRDPSKFLSSQYLSSDGENLASALYRIKTNSPNSFRRISMSLSEIVSSARSVDVEVDEKREEFVVSVEHVDGYSVHSKLLSDGTLRVLALLVVRYDPDFRGTVIFEEPENGIHPGRIPKIVDLLRSMGHVSQDGNTRQIIVNTHSTKVLASADSKEIAVAYSSRANQKGIGKYTKTNIGFVDDYLFEAADKIAKHQLASMLEHDSQAEGL